MNLLGKGGYASVYEEDYKNKKVAVKKLSYAGNSLSKEIIREIIILDCLSKTGYAPRVEGLWLDHNKVNLAMELGQKTMHSFIYNSTLETRLKVFPKVFSSCLKILESLHRSRVVHYDIKPGNILMDSDGNCKIIDFGLSQYVLKHYQQNHRTVYTERYRPPEYVNGGRVYPFAGDVWAMGISLLLFINGKHLGDNFYSTRKHISEDHFRIIESFLSKNPKKRFKYLSWDYNLLPKVRFPFSNPDSSAEREIYHKLYFNEKIARPPINPSVLLNRLSRDIFH